PVTVHIEPLPEHAEPSTPEEAAAEAAADAFFAGRVEDEEEPELPPGPSHFGRTMFMTLASAVIPTSGLIRTKWRAVGIIVASLSVVAAVVIGLGVKTSHILLQAAAKPSLLHIAACAIGVLALLWVTNIVWTYLANQRDNLTSGKRVLGSAAVFVLSLAVAVPLIIGAKTTWQTASIVNSIFGSTQSSTVPTVTPGDPWSGHDRVNVLLLGTNSGDGSAAGFTPGTNAIVLASIDVTTGNTLFIQLPQNMARAPFPSDSDLAATYPHGFYDGHTSSNPDFFLGAMWSNLPADQPLAFAGSTYPGADAMKLSVGAATGLPVDYFVMVNMDGLQRLVDAMGGVTVNVDFSVAMGGSTQDGCNAYNYIPQGPDTKLSGPQALWFGRSSCNDPQVDFGLMQRQACLLRALLMQLDPTALLTKATQIRDGSDQALGTDIPESMIVPFVELVDKVKTANMMRLTFVTGQNGFVASNPNFTLMRQRVDTAIAQSTSATNSQDPDTTTPGTSASGAVDLSQGCAYTPSG
ncbi:MAG: LCP family protein, partial [Propionibacteriaceae bacterium]|nr:LCP family protein [Propionibacteriaceae bacterium]